MKDGHVHSPYCLHGSKDSFQMYIEKAIASGIEEISFTEHFPLPNGFEDPVKEKDSSMDLESLEKYVIPIPPLELQEKIVAILDRFETLVNDLSKGLPAEIEAVKARYEYYRNKLLTFNPLSA